MAFAKVAASTAPNDACDMQRQFAPLTPLSRSERHPESQESRLFRS
jgi:hypothetical protein